MKIGFLSVFFLLFFDSVAANSATPTPVSQFGCFAQSGDGGDAIISDINGYAAPPPSVAVVVTPLTTPPASWPSFCNSGNPISDNNFAYTTSAIPTTMVFQRNFTIAPALISGGSFGITFGADDEASFVLTNSLYPGGVTIASCLVTGGPCLVCQGTAFNGNLLDGSGINTLTISVINTGNIGIGTHSGFAWFHYSICVTSTGPTATPTKSPTNSPTYTYTSTQTNSPTSSFTSTATLTPTNTLTWTPTRTSTQTSTHSPTPTPTNSPTMTYSPTWTPTSTPSRTFTNTRTPTDTFSPTNSPTPTPTFTPTKTFTPTYTPTITFTRTNSPTPTATFTLTKTFTRTNTLTPTSTFTLTKTFTITNTPTITLTPTITSTPTISPTFSGDCGAFEISKNYFSPSQGPVSLYAAYCGDYGGIFSLNVFNTAGEHVRILEDRTVLNHFQGSYVWDGKNKFGQVCADGVYIFRLVEPFRVFNKRVILIK